MHEAFRTRQARESARPGGKVLIVWAEADVPSMRLGSSLGGETLVPQEGL